VFPFIGLANPLDPEFGDEQQFSDAEKYESLALQYAQNDDVENAVIYIEKYIQETGDFSFIERSAFEEFLRLDAYEALRDKYLLKFDMGTFFYLYVGLIGIFIAFMLNFRKRTDKLATGLIGGFVFMHSFFLIHVCLYLTNYTFYQPHVLSISTIFSLLYGPLLYFYYRRVTENYAFKKTDLLHLIPTLVFIAFFLPIYSLSAEDKLAVMMGVGAYDVHPYIQPVTIAKLASLIIYGILTFKVFRSNKTNATASLNRKLQRNIMMMYGVYTLSYAVYAYFMFVLVFSGIIFHFQLLSMTAIVLYVSYVAYANPKMLQAAVQKVKEKIIESKYQNSGLTDGLSLDLKTDLLRLLEDDKIYRQNTIKLATIADQLGTTRHNASQVINEHFGLNFFELINKYRVEEAMLLLGDNDNDLNIIDVAYEVGYNNKVTFNKSFKRFANLTPSQFIKLQAIA